MIHVPDVRAAAEWYEAIGFDVLDLDEAAEIAVFALLSFGDTTIMFCSGGKPGSADRRDVDLYVETKNVDDLYEHIKSRVEIFQSPHDTYYGMREFIVLDPNGFWVTFGESIKIINSRKKLAPGADLNT